MQQASISIQILQLATLQSRKPRCKDGSAIAAVTHTCGLGLAMRTGMPYITMNDKHEGDVALGLTQGCSI
jgi:hypothetical protein